MSYWPDLEIPRLKAIIEEKMERQQAEEDYHDAFDYMLSSAKEHGQQLSIQELKVLESDLMLENVGKVCPA